MSHERSTASEGREVSRRQEGASPASPARRSFLGASRGIAAAAATLALGSLAGKPRAAPRGRAVEVGEPEAVRRRNTAAAIRHTAAQFNRRLPIPDHPDNGDEARYPNRIANYSKGLPHDALGEVDATAYGAFLHALATGRPADFESIPMGCTGARKLVNPQAGLAFDLEGTDSHQFAIPPAPAFDGAQAAGEAAELYWMGLLRDLDFQEYDSSADARAAAADLSTMTDFRGPKAGGRVTPATLFRDDLPGCAAGPYVSQFLWRGTPFGAEFVERRMRTLMPGVDHATTYSEWLALQNGCAPLEEAAIDPVRRYIRNGRDLAGWVHIDVPFQAYFNAMLILLAPPDPDDPVTGGGIGAPMDPGNPYRFSETQDGFGTFGGPHVATVVCEPATRALKAVWFQKWFVHRRLRPEAFGGRVHNHVSGAASYPIHEDLLASEGLARSFERHGSHLLPQAFPEGSPLHPSYGAGHATVAGACVTILKAMFDESFVIPNPVVPTPDGLDLVPYTGPDAGSLTVGGELNKLASNVATGRNIAGIHWRSDGSESLALGEAVAISILRDQRATFNEDFPGFAFTRFDGSTIVV